MGVETNTGDPAKTFVATEKIEQASKRKTASDND